MNAALCVDQLEAVGRGKTLPRKPGLLSLPGGMDFRAGARELYSQWPELRPLLEEAARKIREFFGEEPALFVEPFIAPDSPSEEPSLFLLISTRQSAEEAGATMDRFEGEWWLDNAYRTDHLHISLEFV